jgi:protein-S-isoprenylcysteine O-methyltransferase Ste14
MGLVSNANRKVKDIGRMSIKAAHNKWWQIFEVIFGVPFLVAIVLQITVPWPFPFGFILIPMGVVLIIVGATIVILARREFARYGQPTDPGHPTSRIINTGVFSISRNPLYLGGVCVLAGIALAVNLPWVIVLLIPALITCHYVLITPEEKYLAAKFGEEYHAYAVSVHRWIGRSRSPRAD